MKRYIFPRKIYFKIVYDYEMKYFKADNLCPHGGSYSKDVFSGNVTFHKNAVLASDACRFCIFYKKGDIFTYGIDKKGKYILCNRKSEAKQ